VSRDVNIGPQEPFHHGPAPRSQKVRRGAVRQLRRFGSPSCLLVALILFPLPWVEIQCTARKKVAPTTAFLARSGVQDEMAERLVPWEQETETMFTESGLQAALGAFTPHPKMNDREGIQQLAELVPPAPLMMLFPILLVVGIVSAVLPDEARDRRRKVILACILTALVLMVVQSLLGFPLEKALPR
jgi:hypothetical protein